jgi:hypothetical protein
VDSTVEVDFTVAADSTVEADSMVAVAIVAVGIDHDQTDSWIGSTLFVKA